MPVHVRLLRLVLAFALALCAVSARPCLAQPNPARQEAIELFNQGKVLYKAKDYAGARQKFLEAWGKYPHEPLIALALAKAYDRDNEYKKARQFYERFLELAPATKEYTADREEAVRRRDELDRTIATLPGVLRFKGLPSAAKLEVDGHPTDADVQGEVKVPAGTHTVRVTMKDRVPFERKAVQVGPGETREVEVVLLEPVDPSKIPRDYTWAWVTGGVTAAMAVTTGVLGFQTWQALEHYNEGFDNGRPSDAIRAAYPYAGKPCSLGAQTPDGKLECEASGAIAEGHRRKDDFTTFRTVTIVAAGVTALAAAGTVVAIVSAPAAKGWQQPTAQFDEPGGGWQPRLQWSLLPSYDGERLGASLTLRY